MIELVDTKGGTKMHKQFCSTYMQLSELYFFAGLGLLQPIDIRNINNQPHPQLYYEDLKLKNISRIITDIWKEEINARRLWELRHNKNLPNQKSRDVKIRQHDFGNFELIIAGINYIYTTLVI